MGSHLKEKKKKEKKKKRGYALRSRKKIRHINFGKPRHLFLKVVNFFACN
jgi:hypothetical protein